MKRIDDDAKIGIADDEEIDITAGRLRATSDRTVNEGEFDGIGKWRKCLDNHIGDPDRLAQDAGELE